MVIRMHDIQARKNPSQRSDRDGAAAVWGQHEGPSDVVKGFVETGILVYRVGEAGDVFAGGLLRERVDDYVGAGVELAPVGGDWGGVGFGDEGVAARGEGGWG